MSLNVYKFDAFKSWNISLRTSTKFLIVLYTGGLFGLNVEINGKTSPACFSFGFLSWFWGISRAFLIILQGSHISLSFPLILTDVIISVVDYPLW